MKDKIIKLKKITIKATKDKIVILNKEEDEWQLKQTQKQMVKNTTDFE